MRAHSFIAIGFSVGPGRSYTGTEWRDLVRYLWELSVHAPVRPVGWHRQGNAPILGSEFGGRKGMCSYPTGIVRIVLNRPWPVAGLSPVTHILTLASFVLTLLTGGKS